MALSSEVEAMPRPDNVVVARLPDESEVMSWVGPDCAALLAAEVIPGAV